MIKDNKITNFSDLWVYQDSYHASIIINKEIIPRLPENEKDDLGDQMRRASKAVPRLIAEGYAKRHQRKGFHKYLDDAHAESNELIVCLNHCKDLYREHVDVPLCEKLICVYDKCSRGIFKLSIAWNSYHKND